MIRPFEPRYLDALMALWLESTCAGHPFIDKEYWRESAAQVRDEYIPQSKTWLAMRDNQLSGFISILDEQFIGALFVAPSQAGQGIGQRLLSHAKGQYSALSLEVYQQNQRAVDFYYRQGFQIEDAAWQWSTQQPTWIMRWPKASAL